MSWHNTPTGAVVSHEVATWFGCSDSPTTVRLDWSEHDPFAVLFTFAGPDGPVQWAVSRELLAEALRTERPVGIGDVVFEPGFDAAELAMTLRSPHGTARAEFFADELTDFLTDTEDHIPMGEELLWFPLDQAIEALLAREDDEGWPGQVTA